MSTTELAFPVETESKRLHELIQENPEAFDFSDGEPLPVVGAHAVVSLNTLMGGATVLAKENHVYFVRTPKIKETTAMGVALNRLRFDNVRRRQKYQALQDRLVQSGEEVSPSEVEALSLEVEALLVELAENSPTPVLMCATHFLQVEEDGVKRFATSDEIAEDFDLQELAQLVFEVAKIDLREDVSPQ